MELEEIGAEKQGVEVGESKAEECPESCSTHGTVNEMMSDVEEKKIRIFLVVLLSSIYQFQIIFGLKSSEEEVLLS